MSGSNELLSEEELALLLAPASTEVDEAAPVQDPWVSEDDGFLRSGDLSTTPFAEVLRSVRGEEVVLRLFNPLEEHLVYVKGDVAQDLVSQRLHDRRLGRRLVRAGLVEDQQVVEALEAQRRRGHPLGRVLIDTGVMDERLLSEQIEAQAVEDLYSLFTWTVGQFEVRSGGPEEDLEELFEWLPRFKIGDVLAEVGERDANWTELIDMPGGFDGVPRPTHHKGSLQLSAAHASVLRELDGEKTLRELAEVTMLGLFDCARAVKDLYEWKMVEAAAPAQLLSIARSRLVQGETKRAALVLHAMWGRLDPADREFATEVARLLHRCGEHRLAARCLLTIADTCELEEDRLVLVQEAYRADPRSNEVLLRLRDMLEARDDHDDLMVEVCCALTDALARDGRFEDALDIIGPLALPRADRVSALGRKVRLLCKLDRCTEAVEALQGLAELYQELGDRRRLASVYEHILRIDRDRRDVAAKLARLRRDTGRTVRIAVVMGVLLLASAVGAVLWMQEQRAVRFADFTAQVRSFITQGDVRGALAALDAGEEFRYEPVTHDLKKMVLELRARQHAVEKAERARLLKRLETASTHMERGDLASALEIYGELVENPRFGREVTEVACDRFGAVEQRIEDQVNEGDRHMPREPAGALDKMEAIAAAIGTLEIRFDPEVEQLVSRVIEQRDSAVLARLLGDEARERLGELAIRAAKMFDLAAVRLQAYRALRSERERQLQLGPVLEAAQKHEAEYRYRDALNCYTRLIEDYPQRDSGLTAMFQQRRERCAMFVELLDRLEGATQRGDTKGARSYLRILINRDRSVPFGQIVDLPVRVTSVPPGALVKVNGQPVGRTPLVCRHRPSSKTRLEITLPGFVSESVKLEGADRESVEVSLGYAAHWRTVTEGVVEHPTGMVPVYRSDDERLLMVSDRAGRVTAVDRDNGARAWSFNSGDLSGLVPLPVIVGDTAVLTTRDGIVYGLDPMSAVVRWKVEDIPCEGAPVRCRGLVVAGTVGGEIVGIEPRSGSVRYRVQLKGSVRTRLVARDGTVFAVTRKGWLAAIQGSVGKVMWQVRIGDACSSGPAVFDKVVIGVAEGGRVTAVRAVDGTRVWQKFGVGEITNEPVIAGDSLILAGRDRVIMLGAANGARGPVIRREDAITTSPLVVGERVLVGFRSGRVEVLDAKTLELRYLLRGPAPVSGLIGSEDGVVAAFTDRSLQFFARLH